MRTTHIKVTYALTLSEIPYSGALIALTFSKIALYIYPHIISATPAVFSFPSSLQANSQLGYSNRLFPAANFSAVWYAISSKHVMPYRTSASEALAICSRGSPLSKAIAVSGGHGQDDEFLFARRDDCSLCHAGC